MTSQGETLINLSDLFINIEPGGTQLINRPTLQPFLRQDFLTIISYGNNISKEILILTVTRVPLLQSVSGKPKECQIFVTHSPPPLA